MLFNILIICVVSFFVKADADNSDSSPVEVIRTPSGTDVFCVFGIGRWAKPSHIHEKIPSAQRMGVFRLLRHRLDFNYYSDVKKGSIPTMVPDCGYEVWGAFYFIPIQDLDLVLTKGGVINNVRISHFVQNIIEAFYYGQSDPVNLKCGSFQQIDLPEKVIYGLPLPENQRPSKEILDEMVDALNDAGVPKEYVNEVAQIPIRSQDIWSPNQSKRN